MQFKEKSVRRKSFKPYFEDTTVHPHTGRHDKLCNLQQTPA